MSGTIDGALRELKARNEFVKPYACGCIGPQNGEPLCPCQMRSVIVRDGRYYRVEDLGPVADPELARAVGFLSKLAQKKDLIG